MPALLVLVMALAVLLIRVGPKGLVIFDYPDRSVPAGCFACRRACEQ